MTRSRDLANLADSTEFTAADNTKLDGIEASATADQTNAQIKTAVEAGADIALGGNPTTTTQSAGNNTTRVATTAFTQAAITALVDSSPASLNTLNELADALGDDANFSTTVTNSIATKLPLSGGTMTGNLTAPNLVASGSLSLNDGTDNFNIGVTTNRLTIKSTTSDGSDDTSILIDAGAGGESSSRGGYIEVHGNETSADPGKVIYQMGSVSGSTHEFRKAGGNNAVIIDSSGEVGIGIDVPLHALHINASATGAIPTNAGVGVSDEHPSYFGFHNTSNSATYSGIALETRTSGASRWLIANEWKNTYLGDLVFRTRDGGSSSSEILRMNSSGNVGIGNTVTDNWRLEVLGARVSSGGGYAVAAFRDSTAYNTTDNGAGITFQGLYTSGGSYTNFATIQAIKLDNTNGNYNTCLKFLTRAHGSNMAEAMRIDQDANVLVGKIASNSDANGVELLPGGTVYITANNTLPFYINRRGTSGNNEFARFSDDGATRGTIASSYANELKISASGTNSSGILFSSANQVRPMKNGDASNGTQDLGTGNGRWKDLYLSGGVNFGNASGNTRSISSNLLDDYEEGLWTPDLKLANSGSVTYSARAGRYTKIGREVTAHCMIFNTAHVGTGLAYIHGLPFTHLSSNSSESVGSAQMNQHSDSHSSDIGAMNSIIQGNEAKIHIRATHNSNNQGPLYIQLQNFTYLRISITYTAA